MTPLRQPRWLYRLHAFLAGYFWLPCDVCGRHFSGWEWGRDNHLICLTDYSGVGVCSAECVQKWEGVNPPRRGRRD